MAGMGVTRVRAPRRGPTSVRPGYARPGRGRHRLGRPGLCYCRQLHDVRVRLASGTVTRHAAPVSLAQVRIRAELVALLLVAVITGTVMVSGWYTAAGASVIADIVAR